MEESIGDFVGDDGKKVDGLDPREVSRVFSFSCMPLANLVVVSDFR